MYLENQEIDSEESVHMWIGEGLRNQCISGLEKGSSGVKGTHLMDMAIGHKYFKILVDFCLFQIVKEKKDVWPR